MKSGFVALAGKPNAGKSTLLNALIKQKIAIVSAKPQTTRSEIRGMLNTEDAQIIFTDTPGIHKPNDRLGARMNKQATSVMQGVDLVYLVVDGTEPFTARDEYILRVVQQLEVPVFLILNKVDIMNKDRIIKNLQKWQSKFEFAEYFPISSMKDEDFTDLIQTTISYLPEGDRLYPDDIVTDETDDFRMSEIIREKILICTEQEVPHATAVLIEHKSLNEDNSMNVQALVLVERQGQKAILIGKQGKMLGKIRYEAEKEISRVLEYDVHLDIFVRVEEEWRNKDRRIDDFGYGVIDG